MPKRAPGFVTVLMRLPLFYSPDARGERKPVEDEKFLQTADEIAQKFGGSEEEIGDDAPSQKGGT